MRVHHWPVDWAMRDGVGLGPTLTLLGIKQARTVSGCQGVKVSGCQDVRTRAIRVVINDLTMDLHFLLHTYS